MKQFMHEILSFQNLNWRHWILIFSAYLLFHIPVVLKSDYNSNLAIMQAEAFLKGNLNIDSYFWDASVFEGKYFVCFPPFPAVLVTPLVAMFGNAVNTIFLSLVISCLSMYLLYQLLIKLIGDSTDKLWVFLGFFFGSGYWWVVLTSDHINGFAHVVCICLLLMLLLELHGKKRALIVGVLLALAFLTRQMTVFYGILILYFFYVDEPNKKIAIRNIAVAFMTAFVCVIPYFVLNHLRFHNPFDTGYQYLIYAAPIQERINEYGLFSTKYFLYNFYHLLVKGHNLLFAGSMNLQVAGIDQYGTSILAASPFIIFAFKAQQETKFKIAFWSTIVLILSSILLYHNNGWMQVNTQRFSLDFFPALLILIALSYPVVPKWLFKSFVIYSIALNLLSFTIHSLR
ncbi:MAG: glycosyltransferase family 39 protein [Cyclobacteriaceae bacterium]|nr:glycosyltransferase family 39 protein [Cyclobacteriaceae bacterium]UYN85827.1 MAG: glycosyltransferase family 39 protein [Cyclobacteriaceae bacterium]